MKIKVQKEHIECADSTVSGCPIARAVFDETGAWEVEATGDSIMIDGTHCAVPGEAFQFMCNFDDNRRDLCLPFSFELSEEVVSP